MQKIDVCGAAPSVDDRRFVRNAKNGSASAAAAAFPRAMRTVLLVCAAVVLTARAVHAEPTSVTIAGTFQSAAGCSGNWVADCSATHLTYDATGHVWRGTFLIPSGLSEYKAALNDSWDLNYPASNLSFTLPSDRSVTFYYSDATHWVTSNAQADSVIATVPGDFQSELGCTGDWDPACLASWLQDADGDGTYTFSTTALLAGNYQAKVAINEAWDENYGDGGTPGGSNIAFTVPYDNAQMTFYYVASTHILTISARHGAPDNSISWTDLFHDSRDHRYRTPGGAVITGTAVKVRLRALTGDLTGAQVSVWNDRTNTQWFVTMTLASSENGYDWWEATLVPGADPTILYYRFIAQDGTALVYYEDDAALDGGSGTALASMSERSWQIAAYDAAFTTPDWAKNGIVYQIFPDRFRNGDSSNDTAAGSFYYGEPGGSILRSGQSSWNQTICDPRDMAGPCPNKYNDNFYGGDLQGIIDKLPYLSDLGVSVLYLNPIFESPSNHKYDTSDYDSVDDNLGTLTTFQSLTSAAHSLNMKVVLDGAFNHTSSDSKYFDRYHRYASSNGACEDTLSPFRSWYYFQPAGTPGSGPCAGDAVYTSWYGYDSMPKLDGGNSATRQLIWDSTTSVSRYWLSQGADGWRLDVPGDIDPGLTNDPLNNYWEGFRSAVRAEKSDAWIVGEEWGVATPWTLGGEWDAAMNYQFSSAVLGFWRDETFTDDDHTSGSSAGLLSPLTPSQLDARLHNLEERYPPEAFFSMMNILDSHDTSRALFMLDHRADENNASIYASASYDWSDAITRLKGAVLLQMTLPGAPAIYYGDEVGLVGPPVYSGGMWQDDPYNRQPFPWLDETGTPFYTHLQTGAGQDSLRTYYQLLTTTRNAHGALRTGSFDTLLVDDANKLYAYGRKLADSSDAAVVMVNRGAGEQTVAVNVSGYLPEGAMFHDALNSNAACTVTGGVLSVPNVPARSGALLVLASTLTAAPDAVTDLAVAALGPSSVTLSWSASSGAMAYDVYKTLLSGGGYTLAASTATTGATVSGLTTGTTYYFVVVARNTTTGLTSANSNEVTAVPHYDLSDSGNTWFDLHWPTTIAHTISATTRTEAIYGQIWINGVTDPAGPAVGIRAQVGYGPDGTTPDLNWQWVEMAFSSQQGNNDEFTATLLPEATGQYDYAVRYSSDNGAQWFYADLNGPQRDGTLDNPGALTVTQSADTTAPATPQGLTVVSTSTSAITLSWSANAEGDLAGYEVFREAVAAPGYSRIALVTSGATYTDTSVTGAAAYHYFIKAYDTSFNRSAASSVVEATALLRYVDITFNVTLPSFTPAGTVYITGDISELGLWNPAGVATAQSSPTLRTYTLHVLDGTAFSYQFTRGTWETVEKGANGFDNVSRQWTAAYGTTGTQTINDTVANWRDPLVVSHSPVSGATNVATSTTISVTWSYDIQADTDFSVTQPGGSVSGTFVSSGITHTTTFTPAQPLLQGTSYTVLVSGEQSFAYDLQQVPTTWSFTTACNVSTPSISAGGGTAFCQGGSVTLTSSSASGNHWYKDGTPIAGATSQSYMAGASGAYTVVVIVDGCTTAPSNTINVSVTPLPPTPTISAGGATTFCAGGSVTLTSSSTTGNQWYRNGSLLSGATAKTYGATTSGAYTVVVTANGCPSSPSAATNVTVTPLPTPPTISGGPTSFCDGGSVTLTSSSTTGNQWYRDGGLLAGQTGQTILASVGGSYAVTTTSSGCTSAQSAAKQVIVRPKPDATITVPASIYLGASSAASVNVVWSEGTFSWSVTGGTITSGNGTPQVTFTASAAGTLTLQVTVTNASGCSDTKSANVAVQLAAFGAPPYLRATASGTSAMLQWAAVASADHYEVYRSTDNVNWTPGGSSKTTTLTDSGLALSTVYLYRVRAVKADATASAFSSIDPATTVTFRNPWAHPVTIQAVDVTALRTAINLLRSSVGLDPATFTDPSIAAGSPIRAVHLTDLRSALAPALAAISVTTTYTDPTLTARVTAVKAAHVGELQDLVR